jgi:sec-independent protein translocase protein TatA
MFRNPLTDSIVVLVVLLLIFGPKRLPALGRSLGQGIKEFRHSIRSPSTEDQPEDRALITAQASAPGPAVTQPQATPEQ